jgi:exonuclease VII small subunit
MKLTREFIRRMIRESLYEDEIPTPGDQREEMVKMLSAKIEELEQTRSSLTGMGEYFQGLYADWDSDLTVISDSIEVLVKKIESEILELEKAGNVAGNRGEADYEDIG